MTYFDNVQEVCTQANQVAWTHRDPKAWDNRKGNICKRQLPRGKVYKRLLQLERTKFYRHMVEAGEAAQRTVNKLTVK